MARTVFFLGRGPDARPLASLYQQHADDNIINDPTPEMLADLHIGRPVLTATDSKSYTKAVTTLVIGWRSGGCAAAFTSSEEQLENDTCPHVDGTFSGHTASQVPVDLNFRLAYAYDDGQVWLWQAGIWRSPTIDTADSRPDHRPVPAARRYGESYADTATLDLPHLAVWIMAELVTRAADPNTALPPQLRYAAAVNPTRREIRFTVFGVRDDHQYHQYPDIPAQHVIAASTAPILDAHNWTNPTDATDRRFTYEIHTPEQYLQNIETKRHRGPGTLTVIDTDKTDWSWRQ